MSSETSLTLTLDDRDEALLLFGSRDQNLRLIREALGVRLVARGDFIHVEGTPAQVDQAQRIFQQLRLLLKKQGKLSQENVRSVLTVVQTPEDQHGPHNVTVIEGNRHVRPRTDGQARYVNA